MSDAPKGDKQNISFHYGFVLRWSLSQLPELTVNHAARNEVKRAAWVKVTEAQKWQLAFSHNERLQKVLQEQTILFKEMEIKEG